MKLFLDYCQYTSEHYNLETTRTTQKSEVSKFAKHNQSTTMVKFYIGYWIFAYSKTSILLFLLI